MVTKFLPLGAVRGGCKGFLCNIFAMSYESKIISKIYGFFFFPPKGIEKYKLINLKFRFGDTKHWEYLTLGSVTSITIDRNLVALL